MDEISRVEFLALLGYMDLPHSYNWYRDRFPKLPQMLRVFIHDELVKHNAFPKEAKEMTVEGRCKRYYYTIETKGNKHIVNDNDTDRGIISKQTIFNDANGAVDYLILHSYSTGGAIKDYWSL